MTHALDAALAQSLPVMPVPRYGAFEPLPHCGSRILLASSGIYIEVRRPWLYAVQPCATPRPGLMLPFGDIAPVVQPAFGTIPAEFVQMFIDLARAALPNEVGAVVTFNVRTSRLALRPCVSEDASTAHLRYRMPPLEPDEYVVLDVHSHGHLPAGFSSADDHDDRGATKFAMVIGCVHRDPVQMSLRLLLNGVRVPLMAAGKASGLEVQCAPDSLPTE